MLERFEFVEGSGWVHERGSCDGQDHCVIHNPSLHSMIEEPLGMYDPTGRTTPLLYRLCRHGIKHPDPDSLAWVHRRSYMPDPDHSDCDGCCTKLERINHGPTTTL